MSTFGFEAVVGRLRDQGIKLVKKRKFQIEAGDQLVMIDPGPFELDEPELAEPEFWIPTAFDGEGWKEQLCIPQWFRPSNLTEWLAYGEMVLRWEDELGEFSNEPMKFVRTELSQLRMLSDEEVGGKGCSRLSAVASGYMKRAMVEAYALEGGFPPRDLESLGEGECLRLAGPIASIIELAFRAGRLSARAKTSYRGVSETAMLGMAMDRSGSRTTDPWVALIGRVQTEVIGIEGSPLTPVAFLKKLGAVEPEVVAKDGQSKAIADVLLFGDPRCQGLPSIGREELRLKVKKWLDQYRRGHKD